MSSVADRLVWARTQKGFRSASDAARFLAIPYPTYAPYENGSRNLPRDNAIRIAHRFGVSLNWLLTGAGQPTDHAYVPIVGIARASSDGNVTLSESPGELGEAPIPPGWTERTVAVEIEGFSQRGVAEDSWLAYYDDRRDPPTDDLLHQLCVVGTGDDRVLVKYLEPGRKPGHYDLESTNAPTLRDVPIVWAAPVKSLMPKRQARRAGLLK